MGRYKLFSHLLISCILGLPNQSFEPTMLNSKNILIIIFLSIFIFSSDCLWGKKISEETSNLTGLGAIETGEKAAKDVAISKAKDLFKQKIAEGLDMSNGPCLSNEIIPDWVVDVAHNPREEIDNQPENQCSAFREGKAQHFIELDPMGNLIRAE